MQIVTDILIDETAASPGSGKVLVLGGEAALPNALTDAGDSVHWMPTDVRERDAALRDVVVLDDEVGRAYERILLPVPPDRDLARRWLMTAHASLSPDGSLLVVGSNAEGAKSVIADAAKIFGRSVSESYRQKHRIARFMRRDVVGSLPPWATADGVVPGTWQRFDVPLGDEALTLETTPGVFAGNRLDAGTRLLLETMQVETGSRVLDVGCGVGVIGIHASRQGAAHVDLVDANLLAVQAAARNLDRHGVPGRAIASDVYDAVHGERYDLIVSNPPFHRGKQVDLSVADRLIDEAPKHLRPEGRILIVANAFLAYGKQMQRVFRHVETVNATRQYHVLMAREPR